MEQGSLVTHSRYSGIFIWFDKTTLLSVAMSGHECSKGETFVHLRYNWIFGRGFYAFEFEDYLRISLSSLVVEYNPGMRLADESRFGYFREVTWNEN